MKAFVLKSRAAMPAKCWGRYARIGVILSLDDRTPCQIRQTRNFLVVKTWERRFDGRTKRCAAEKAYEEGLLASMSINTAIATGSSLPELAKEFDFKV